MFKLCDICCNTCTKTRTPLLDFHQVRYGISWCSSSRSYSDSHRRAGVRVNGQYYRDIMQGHLPGLLHPNFLGLLHIPKGRHTGAQSSRDSWILGNETPNFIPPTLWQPNSPDLNPVDYNIWNVMRESVHRTKVRDIKDLRQRRLSCKRGTNWSGFRASLMRQPSNGVRVSVRVLQ